MTNSEKQILTMAINDSFSALEYAEKCGNEADIERARARYSAARKAYKAAKAAKPRKAAHQDGLPQVEIGL